MKRRNLILSLLAITAIAVGGVVATILTDTKPQLGLDLQGGASVTLQPVGTADEDSLNVVVDILRNRIDSLGVAEPEIIRQGQTVVVNLPGVKDQDRAIELVGQTGKVLFRPVLAVTTVDAAAAAAATSTTTTVPGATSTTVPGSGAPNTAASSTTTATSTTAAPASGGSGPTTTTLPPEVANLITPRAEDTPANQVVLPGRDGVTLYTLGPAFAIGDDAISSADAVVQNGEWKVELVLKEGAKGLDAWNAMAGKCYTAAQGGQDAECPQGGMAIVLDGEVIAAPVPQEPFFSSPNVEVSGGGTGFKQGEARDLARVLKYGSAPVELKPQAAQTVSATLGKDSLRAGLVAGIVGVALVVLLMFLYYRRLAIVVVGGLLVTGCLLWTTISWLSKTSGLSLTLAGATGIIVSIGVTVDSYVVYFERMKDDVRAGKSLRAAAPRSFKSAWRTIIAADVVSLLGAGVLWYLSVGSVRGFAFFLGLSTAYDLVVTWFFVRPAVVLLSQTSFLQTGDRVLGVRIGEAALAGGAA
jgi:preprotein translocase subunit SecD